MIWIKHIVFERMIELSKKLNEIRAIENKYGLVIFRMGLTHLIEIGTRHFTEESLAECLQQIETEAETDKAENRIPIMTPEFKCEIVRCAAELAKFSIWTVIAYIKKYVSVDGCN